jgi:APA family basic amino acid/polyamine antiporter
MATTKLPATLGFWSCTALIIGCTIGSGVFIKPAAMAAELGSPVWLTIIWIIGGIFSLFGALIYAELGAMMPETGGLYVYFRYMFGEFWGYLYGWAAFAVINTASTAAIAFVCAQYADYFLHLPRLSVITENSFVLHLPFLGDLFPLANLGVKMLAIAIIIGLTAINHLSLKAGDALQVISTFLKILVIGGLIVGIFASGNGSVSNFYENGLTRDQSLMSSIVLAMTGAFFAYDGWVGVTFVAGEVKDPGRNIPRSMFVGVITVIIIYVLVNQAYLYVLPVKTMAGSTLVAADAIAVGWGTKGGAIVAALIVISTFGAINGNTLANCRITWAMGQDRVFLPWVGETHKRFRTPANALWLHAILTVLYIFTGSFDMLADMFIFITWIAYGAGAVGIFLLRKRMPNAERPYKIWGYPWVPIIFIAFTTFYLVITIWNDISNYIHHRQPVINSLLGMLITAVGIPVYYYYKKRKPLTNTVAD